MLCLPVLGLVYNLYESRTMSRTARDDKLLEAMDAMGFGGDTADEGADGPGGPDDSGAGLYGTEEERPRGWWARMKKWFRWGGFGGVGGSVGWHWVKARRARKCLLKNVTPDGRGLWVALPWPTLLCGVVGQAASSAWSSASRLS